MNTLSLTRPLSYAAPRAAATEQWANGVKHTDGEVDVYELPTQSPGVAARIELKPRFFGLCTEVTVKDCQGNELKAWRQQDGWHKEVVAQDPRSGLLTVFDPTERTIDVATPTTEQSESNSTGNWIKKTYQRDARQSVDAQGNCTYVSNLRGESEIVLISMVREMPANNPHTISDHKTYEQTRIEKGQQPVTHKVEAGKYEKKEAAQLASSVSPDGKLTVVGEDGATRAYEMFLRV